MENKNTIILDKNITIVSEPKLDVVRDYNYKHKDGDKLVFCESIDDAVKLFSEEDYDVTAVSVFGGRFPDSMLQGKKSGYDYFFIGGRTKTDGKFFIYPGKSVSNDYL